MIGVSEQLLSHIGHDDGQRNLRQHLPSFCVLISNRSTFRFEILDSQPLEGSNGSREEVGHVLRVALGGETDLATDHTHGHVHHLDGRASSPARHGRSDTPLAQDSRQGSHIEPQW